MDSERCGMYGITTTALHVFGLRIQGGQPVPLHQSTGVTIALDGSRDLFLWLTDHHDPLRSVTTNSDQYLNFNSYTTHWHTRHSGPDTSHLADQICLNIGPDRVIEEKQISGALTNNGYPSGLVKWYWQHHPPPTSIPEPNTCRAVVVIPYLQHLSESNRHILSLPGMSIWLRPHNTPTCV